MVSSGSSSTSWKSKYRHRRSKFIWRDEWKQKSSSFIAAGTEHFLLSLLFLPLSCILFACWLQPAFSHSNVIKKWGRRKQKRSSPKRLLARKMLSGSEVSGEESGNNDTFYTTQKGCDDGTLNFGKKKFLSPFFRSKQKKISLVSLPLPMMIKKRRKLALKTKKRGTRRERVKPKRWMKRQK